MTQPIGLCDQRAKDGVDLIERTLGIPLPDCATVTANKDGIRATQTDALGTHLVVEINNKGEVFRSTDCGEETIGMISYQEKYDGSTETVPACRNNDHVRDGSVSPDKLAKARALILGAKIKSTPIVK